MTRDTQINQSSLDVVTRHEDAALAALEAATGGAPLCRIDHTRQSVKAHEGAASALAEVRRALRKGADPVESVLEHVRERWAILEGPLARRPGSEEYAAGGRAALSALARDLDPAEGPAD